MSCDEVGELGACMWQDERSAHVSLEIGVSLACGVRSIRTKAWMPFPMVKMMQYGSSRTASSTADAILKR